MGSGELRSGVEAVGTCHNTRVPAPLTCAGGRAHRGAEGAHSQGGRPRCIWRGGGAAACMCGPLQMLSQGIHAGGMQLGAKRQDGNACSSFPALTLPGRLPTPHPVWGSLDRRRLLSLRRHPHPAHKVHAPQKPPAQVEAAKVESAVDQVETKGPVSFFHGKEDKDYQGACGCLQQRS